MGNVAFKRRWYEVTEESISIDEQLKIYAVKKVSGNVVEKITDIVKSNVYRDTAKILEQTVGEGDIGVKQRHSEYRFMKEIFGYALLGYFVPSSSVWN